VKKYHDGALLMAGIFFAPGFVKKIHGKQGDALVGPGSENRWWSRTAGSGRIPVLRHLIYFRVFLSLYVQ
jgi:hypothetical protein